MQCWKQEDFRSHEREQTQHGKYMVVASAALITAKNVKFDQAVVQKEPDTSLCEGDRPGGLVTVEWKS